MWQRKMSFLNSIHTQKSFSIWITENISSYASTEGHKSAVKKRHMPHHAYDSPLQRQYFHGIGQSAGLLVDCVLSLGHHHTSLQNEPNTLCTIQWATWCVNAQCKMGKEKFCKQKCRSCCAPTFRNFVITFQLRSNISNTLVSFWSSVPFLDNCHNPPPKNQKAFTDLSQDDKRLTSTETLP